MKFHTRLFGALALLLSALAAQANTAYEVKLFVDPALTLDAQGQPTAAVWQAFGLNGSQANDYALQYLDTDGQTLKNAGWSVRIRKKDSQGKHRIQYKKRYPVAAGDVAAALAEADGDGFDLQDEDWKIEVDWGYSNQTLSLALTEQQKFNKPGGALGMPNLADSIKQAKSNAPDAFTNWSAPDWGKNTLDDSRIYGVVYFTRCDGGSLTYNNEEIEDLVLEVWQVLDAQGSGHEYLVEVSFRAEGFAAADSKRSALMSYLANQNWLLYQDVLRTQLVLDRY